MMNKRTLLIVATIGLIAGLAGGVLAVSVLQRGSTIRQSTGIVRAERFEAVGADGTVRASFGLASGELPQVILFGPNGKERLAITLDNVDEPLILMKDTKDEIRVVMGHETSDTASPDNDDWSVAFQKPGEPTYEERKAVIGMMKAYPSRTFRGFVAGRDERGQGWRLPEPSKR